MERTQFVTDTEIISYLDRSYRDLYNLIVTSHDDYFVTSGNISITTATDTYSLASDFYKLLGVDINRGTGNIFTLRPFSFNERNRGQNVASRLSSSEIYRYILYQSSLKFIPFPTQADTAVVWYVPVPTAITLSSQSIDGVNGWDEYVSTDAAIKCVAKEESDTSALMAHKAELKADIVSNLAGRDEGMPRSVQDLDALSSSQWRSGGW